MSTEIKIFQLALNSLMEEVVLLKSQNAELKKQFDDFKEQNKSNTVIVPSEPAVSETVLLDTKDVLRILGVCYNTLQKIVAKGLLIPIKINQRRVRYSKIRILEYLRMKHQTA
jgi:hypothetical protein